MSRSTTVSEFDTEGNLISRRNIPMTREQEFVAEAAIQLETAMEPIIRGVDMDDPIDDVLLAIKRNVKRLVLEQTTTSTDPREQVADLTLRLATIALWSIVWVRRGEPLRRPS